MAVLTLDAYLEGHSDLVYIRHYMDLNRKIYEAEPIKQNLIVLQSWEKHYAEQVERCTHFYHRWINR